MSNRILRLVCMKIVSKAQWNWNKEQRQLHQCVIETNIWTKVMTEIKVNLTFVNLIRHVRMVWTRWIRWVTCSPVKISITCNDWTVSYKLYTNIRAVHMSCCKHWIYWVSENTKFTSCYICCKFCIYTHPENSKFTTWHIYINF